MEEDLEECVWHYWLQDVKERKIQIIRPHEEIPCKTCDGYNYNCTEYIPRQEFDKQVQRLRSGYNNRSKC